MTRLQPCAVELFVTIFRYLKLELLKQFTASSDEKKDFFNSLPCQSEGSFVHNLNQGCIHK